jgi:hypothetical protein
MSRRNLVVLLAASAALTATYAVADPECFGGSCRLPALVELPAVVPLPAPQAVPVFRAPSEASQAFAQSPRRPLPQLAPSSEAPSFAAEPPYRRSERVIVRDFEPATMRVAEPLAPSRVREEGPRRPTRRHGTRVVQGQIDAGPLVGYPLAGGPVLLGAPTVIYGGYAVRPVYLVAPSAKIIHVDRDDD